MNKYNTSYEYKQVNSKFILSDPSYQRSLDLNRVKRIASTFDRRLVNPIKVSLREGKYYVFDGQHTLAALKSRNHNRDLMVECKVYYNLTAQDEAILFSEQNGLSRSVSSIAKYKALYAAGDQDVVNLVTHTAMAGFFINFTNGKAKNKIICVSKAFKVFKSCTPIEYIDVLKIIKDAWDGIPESLSTEILGGMSIFWNTYKGRFNRSQLIKQLRKVNPVVIIRDGKAFGANMPGDSKYAAQILNVYNRKLRGNKLPSEFLGE